MLGGMLKRILCPSSWINHFNSVSYDTQTTPLNLNTPSDPNTKSLAYSEPSNPTVLWRLGSVKCFSLIKIRISLDIVKLLHLLKSAPKTIYNFISLNFCTNSNSLIII